MTNALPLSLLIYERLLALYPADLRRQYGAEMALVFADDLADARRESGLRGVFRVWRCALGEFLRFALPAWTSNPAVRVPVFTCCFTLITMGGEMAIALRHAPHDQRILHTVSAVLAMPLLCSPLISLASVWACRGRGLTALELSNHPPEDSPCSKRAI